MRSALGGALAVLLVLVASQVVLGGPITPEEEKLVRAALEGGRLEKYWLYKHRWNMRQVEQLGFADDGTFVARGHFRHYKMAAEDDTVKYTVKIKDGQLVDDPKMIEFEHAFDWRLFIARHAHSGHTAVKPLFYGNIFKETLAEFQNNLGDLKNQGSNERWEQAATKVVILIARSGFERMQTVTAYTDANQRGRRQIFAAGAYNAREFTRVGNDRISSLFVPKGFAVKVCQHDNSGGPCQTYTGESTINLPAPFDNSISYIQVSRVGLTPVSDIIPVPHRR